MTGDLRRIYFDWDKPNTLWFCLDGVTVQSVSKDKFLEEDFWAAYAGSVLRIEDAHLRPREKSKAQPFEQPQLGMISVFVERHGWAVEILSGRLSKRACMDTMHMDAPETTEIDSDQGDLFPGEPTIGTAKKPKKALDPLEAHRNRDDHCMARCLHRFYSLPENERISVCNWPKKPAREYLNNLWDSVKEIIDGARVKDNKSGFTDRVRDLLDRYHYALSPDDRENLGVYKTKRKMHFDESAVYAVAAAVLDKHGKLRTRDDGRFIGVRTAKALLGLHHFGHKSIARANIMWHWLRFKVDYSAPDRREQRRPFVRSLLKLIGFFRDASLGKYKSQMDSMFDYGLAAGNADFDNSVPEADSCASARLL